MRLPGYWRLPRPGNTTPVQRAEYPAVKVEVSKRPGGTIFVRLRGKVHLAPGSPIYLKHIAELAGPELLMRVVSRLSLGRCPLEKNAVLVISCTQVAKRITEALPDASISLHGEEETLVVATPPDDLEESHYARVVSSLRLALVCVLLFVGSAMALMNFHADVNMPAVHSRLHYILTGEHASRSLWIQIPYSLGIGLGALIFFGHFLPRRPPGQAEPSPLEVEMFLYQENLDRCVAKTKEAVEAERAVEEEDG